MSDTITISRPATKTEKPKYAGEIIGLPSEGYFYSPSNPLSRGVVDIKYMTAKEEDILSSENLIKKGVVLQKLLESLILTDGVLVDDLLIGDKNALFIASRRLAYGDKYGPLDIQCPKCSRDNKCTVDLSSIKNKDYDFSKFEKGKNEFEFTLPTSKKTIGFKLLTHKEDSEIDKELESFKKIQKNGASPEITCRLKKMITSVEGNSDRQSINKFVETELLSRDSLALRQYVKEITPDIDMNFEFNCEHCSHVERIGIPLVVSFFWPNAGV